MTIQCVTSKILGSGLILFGILCMCAVPLYLFLYDESKGTVAEIAAVFSGLLIGAATVYSGAAVFRMNRAT